MAESAESVHRLKDILVEEVSLVDRAANKRRFLLVKREGEMSELRSNGRGGFTKVTKADEEDPEVEKAKAPPFGGNKAPPFGAKEEKETEKAAEVDGANAEETEKAKKAPPPFPPPKESEPEVEKAGDDVAESLEDIASMLLATAQEMEGEPSDAAMKKVISAHKKLGSYVDKLMTKTTKRATDLAKVGRKMSGARLEQFKASLATLSGLLAELMDSPAKEATHEPDAGDPQTKAKGWSASNPSDAPGNAKGAAAIKSDPAVEALAKSMAQVVEINKALVAKVKRLENGVIGSNSIPVEKSGAMRSEEISWPLDMNGHGRGTVAKGDKGDSFIDE